MRFREIIIWLLKRWLQWFPFFSFLPSFQQGVICLFEAGEWSCRDSISEVCKVRILCVPSVQFIDAGAIARSVFANKRKLRCDVSVPSIHSSLADRSTDRNRILLWNNLRLYRWMRLHVLQQFAIHFIHRTLLLSSGILSNVPACGASNQSFRLASK